MAHGYNVLSIQRTNRRSPQVYVVTRFDCNGNWELNNREIVFCLFVFSFCFFYAFIWDTRFSIADLPSQSNILFVHTLNIISIR